MKGAASRHVARLILGFLARRPPPPPPPPRPAAIDMGSVGFEALPSSHLDPDHVFALVISRRPRDLGEYLESIPGASVDLQCHLISFAGRALLGPRVRVQRLPDEDSWTLYWAKYAWAHAANSKLCAPHMAGNPINFASYPDHYLYPLNSSSYSGKMLTVPEPGKNVLSQLSASSSRVPPATFSPEQANSNRTLNQTSAFNSGTRPSEFIPWQADCTLTTEFAELSLGQPGSKQMDPQELLEQNSTVRVPYLHQSGSDQFPSQKLMQNREVLLTVDIKGKRPASEEVQQKLRVNIACLIAEDGSKGAAGLLIKNGMGKFFCAACFPIWGEEPALFAAACCEGFKIARAYQPTIIVLESHQFYLLQLLLDDHTPGSEMEELTELLVPSSYTIQTIPEESNGAAHRLAMRSLLMGVPDIFFCDPPDWLVLT